jgi:hypothetical protein
MSFSKKKLKEDALGGVGGASPMRNTKGVTAVVKMPQTNI